MSTQTDNAQAILAGVGGDANIAALHHCSTRLRFTLVDPTKADADALKSVPGVVGVVAAGGQTQVIVGSRVADVFRAVQKERGPSALRDADAEGAASGAGVAGGAKQKLTWRRVGGAIMDFVVAVFTPIIPAIAGAGILKSLLVALAAIGWLPNTSQTYLVLATIPDAVFAFLPILVAYTAAKKLGVNIPLALGMVAFMLFANFTTLVNQEGGVALFGIQVPVIAYSAQVFPAILAVFLLWPLEKFFTKVSPGPVRVFLVPFLCFLIVAPTTMLLLGPLGFWAGSLLTGAMIGLYNTLGWVAVAITAALLPFVISVGMHKAFIPPTIATMAANGKDSFYLISSLAHNWGEAGACFAVAIRTKDTRLRATAISAGISAVFGITEPALYGVTLQNRRALVAVIAGALAGGAYLGLWAVSAFAVVGPGIASFTMFVDAANPWNVLNAAIGGAVAIGVSFLVAVISWRDDKSASVQASATATSAVPTAATDAASAAVSAVPAGGVRIVAPMTGAVVPLAEVADPVFSGGVLGEGLAIVPTDGGVRAPIAGTVTSLMDSKHAVGITTDEGVEVLVHVGLDTVKLEGAPFTAHVAQGDRVEAGQLLLDADLAAIRAAGYDTTTPVVVVNAERFDLTLDALADGSADVTTGAPLATISTKELSHGAA